MRLINTHTLTLTEFHGASIPPYAILSHTWEGDEEVTFQHLTTLSPAELSLHKKRGYAKIQHTCRLARKSAIDWAWVDTCCIDKSSSAELTEAINSMFRWYAEARVCYAYLADLEPDVAGVGGEEGEGLKEDGVDGGGDLKEKVEGGEKEKKVEGNGKGGGDGGKGAKGGEKARVFERGARTFKKAAKGGDMETKNHDPDGSLAQKVAKFAGCRWFTRGWTLQELIAPRRLGFYNRDWEFQGEKTTLSAVLAEITRISPGVLDDAGLLQTIPVAQRMSWVANRQTTRSEDLAYCLLGIFDVNMPLLYGEGDKAFLRLQEEIIKETNDLTLFAWRLESSKTGSQRHWGVLAPSVSAFADCHDMEVWVDPMHNNECAMTSKGLRVTPVPGGGLRLGTDGTYVMNLQCHRRNRLENLGIFLQQHGCDVYTRVRPDSLSRAHRSNRDKYRMFYVLKAVSPARSVVLSTSHRRAIDLSRALESFKGMGIRLTRTDAFEPEGHWDAQRNLFLTRGTRNFNCRIRFEEDIDTKPCRMVMKCQLGEDGLSVQLETEDQLKPKRWEWLTVSSVQEFVRGQPVYFVMVGNV